MGPKLVVTDLLIVIIRPLGCHCAYLSLVVRQHRQYLWPELGMQPLPALPDHVIRRQGCSRIRAIALHENGTLPVRQRHTAHSSDTGSNRRRSLCETPSWFLGNRPSVCRFSVCHHIT
jgi:hypothetical protein